MVDDGFSQAYNVPPVGAPGQGTVLLWGDDDLEWMDVNEVRIDRLVGAIHAGCTVAIFPGLNYGPPVLRVGLLLCEELQDQGSRPIIDLFDPESYEEYEWIQLRSVGEWTYGGDYIDGGTAQTRHKADIQLDSSNRRKIGKKDALVMYYEWAFPLAADISPAFDVSMTISHDIRALVVSK